MRLGLAKHITLEHIKPIGRSAGALGRRAAAEKRDMCVLKRLRITLKYSEYHARNTLLRRCDCASEEALESVTTRNDCCAGITSEYYDWAYMSGTPYHGTFRRVTG